MEYGIQTLDYEDGESIASAVMGGGNIRVSDIQKNAAGFVGVAFSPAPDNKIIGNGLGPNRGLPVTGMDIKFQMLFDNPDSIDVVMARLLAAKDTLLNRPNASLVFSDTSEEIEQRLKDDIEYLNCHACGGSGHIEDTDQ